MISATKSGFAPCWAVGVEFSLMCSEVSRVNFGVAVPWIVRGDMGLAEKLAVELFWNWVRVPGVEGFEPGTLKLTAFDLVGVDVISLQA